MAGDKKTILDIVKDVDRMNLYQDTSYELKQEEKLTKPSLAAAYELEDKAIRGEYRMPRLAKEVLSEENPTAGGTYKGNVYYSNILPQGKDETPWSKEASNIVSKAANPKAKRGDILAAQNYFVDIGYMHPSEVDGYKGKQLVGMIRRWNLNAGTSRDALFDAMETWKDDLFKDEEDLREGGGDQGGY